MGWKQLSFVNSSLSPSSQLLFYLLVLILGVWYVLDALPLLKVRFDPAPWRVLLGEGEREKVRQRNRRVSQVFFRILLIAKWGLQIK